MQMAVAAETKQVCLAPVTLLEIVDMHARRPEAQQFVIGALLGGVRQFADRVDLTVATSAVPLLVNPGKDAYAVDIDFFVSQFDLARRASTTAESRLIGWYSTMPASAVSQQHQVTEFDTFFKQALTKFYGPTHALVTVHVNVDVAAAVSGTTRDFIVAQEIDAQNHHTSCDAVVDAAVVESLLISQDSIAEQGTTDEPKSVQQLQAQLTALIDCIEKVGVCSHSFSKGSHGNNDSILTSPRTK